MFCKSILEGFVFILRLQIKGSEIVQFNSILALAFYIANVWVVYFTYINTVPFKYSNIFKYSNVWVVYFIFSFVKHCGSIWSTMLTYFHWSALMCKNRIMTLQSWENCSFQNLMKLCKGNLIIASDDNLPMINSGLYISHSNENFHTNYFIIARFLLKAMKIKSPDPNI